MDRELPKYTITRLKIKRILTGAAIGLVLAGGIWYMRAVLQGTISASRIRVAVVGTGTVENTLTAAGEVTPAFEQIITSPIRASIRQVFYTPGSQIRTGQPIILLDKSLTLIELEKLKDQLELKLNGVDKLRMDLDKKIYDADINDKIKSLMISRLRAELEDTKRLHKVGGRTQEDVTKAENSLRIAEYEKSQLENELAYNRQSVGANLKESRLNAQIESKNLKELEHKLKMADIVADRPGVLTWVNDKIGTAVNEGEMLARLADLGSFRIEASCSDIYGDQLKIGLPVIVRLNEISLRGVVTHIRPTVENGIISFSVQLDDSRHASLRPNMKVDVFIVTQRVEKAVRVANGPAFNGKKRTTVFVVENDRARRREVETGISSFDYVEIKRGLQPGEKVIVSDMSQFEHLTEVKISKP